MARCEIRLPADFLDTMSKLSDKTDEIVPRVLEAGGNVVLARVRGTFKT